MVKIACGVRSAPCSGRDMKREGQRLVLAAEGCVWRASVLQLVLSRQRGRRFTADDIRAEASASGVPLPHHQNAWGALFTEMSKRKIIERVDYCESKRDRARARIVSVWVRPKMTK